MIMRIPTVSRKKNGLRKSARRGKAHHANRDRTRLGNDVSRRTPSSSVVYPRTIRAV